MQQRTGNSQTGNTMGSCGTQQTNQSGSCQTVNNPSFRERVAQRAYEKWVKGGRQHGCDKQNWLEAERELLAEQVRYGNSGLTYYR